MMGKPVAWSAYAAIHDAVPDIGLDCYECGRDFACAIRALHEAIAGTERPEADPFETVLVWNAEAGRTQHEVVSAFDRAIDRCKEASRMLA